MNTIGLIILACVAASLWGWLLEHDWALDFVLLAIALAIILWL
jgi:hypothetical protein